MITKLFAALLLMPGLFVLICDVIPTEALTCVTSDVDMWRESDQEKIPGVSYSKLLEKKPSNSTFKDMNEFNEYIQSIKKEYSAFWTKHVINETERASHALLNEISQLSLKSDNYTACYSYKKNGISFFGGYQNHSQCGDEQKENFKCCYEDLCNMPKPFEYRRCYSTENINGEDQLTIQFTPLWLNTSCVIAETPDGSFIYMTAYLDACDTFLSGTPSCMACTTSLCNITPRSPLLQCNVGGAGAVKTNVKSVVIASKTESQSNNTLCAAFTDKDGYLQYTMTNEEELVKLPHQGLQVCNEGNCNIPTLSGDIRRCNVSKSLFSVFDTEPKQSRAKDVTSVLVDKALPKSCEFVDVQCAVLLVDSNILYSYGDASKNCSDLVDKAHRPNAQCYFCKDEVCDNRFEQELKPMLARQKENTTKIPLTSKPSESPSTTLNGIANINLNNERRLI